MSLPEFKVLSIKLHGFATTRCSEFPLLWILKFNYVKNPRMLNGKFGSRSTVSIENSMPPIGELDVDAWAEIMSAASASDWCIGAPPWLVIW